MPTLDWIGKDKVINHHQDVPYRVLEKQYTYNAEDSENMIIHGDNLEALKSLLPKYEGRIKCIYIDPPYNTGNEGWVYNDNVNDPKIKKWLGEVVGKEGEDLSRHDKWLCMMYPRLKLLHKLLADNGAIFVSIDDNELFYLKMICDEIFSSNNFMCTFVWQKRYSPPPDTKGIGYMHENIIMYRKSSDFSLNILSATEKQLARYQNPDNDPRGPWKSTDYTCRYTTEQRPNLNYPITNPNTGEIIFPNKNRAWAMSLETHLHNEKEKRIYWGVDGKNHVPALKNFLSEVKEGRIPNTLLLHSEVGHTQEAKQTLKQIFDNNSLFDTPKPPRLIENLIKIIADKDSIILDSFSGSGTTAHAVLNMNKQDGGNRKFILIEMMNYANTITSERVKRVIDGYKANKKEVLFDKAITVRNLAEGAAILQEAKNVAEKAKGRYTKVNKPKMIDGRLKVIAEQKGAEVVEGTGGDFSFFELGEPLLIDGNLNDKVDTSIIREYVWYMETKKPLTENGNDYYLGTSNNNAYYFYYDKNEVTTLNNKFLSKVKFKAGSYTIYADKCALSADYLAEHNIIFKKIPRDISKL